MLRAMHWLLNRQAKSPADVSNSFFQADDFLPASGSGRERASLGLGVVVLLTFLTMAAGMLLLIRLARVVVLTS